VDNPVFSSACAPSLVKPCVVWPRRGGVSRLPSTGAKRLVLGGFAHPLPNGTTITNTPNAFNTLAHPCTPKSNGAIIEPRTWRLFASMDRTGHIWIMFGKILKIRSDHANYLLKRLHSPILLFSDNFTRARLTFHSPVIHQPTACVVKYRGRKENKQKTVPTRRSSMVDTQSVYSGVVHRLGPNGIIIYIPGLPSHSIDKFTSRNAAFTSLLILIISVRPEKIKVV